VFLPLALSTNELVEIFIAGVLAILISFSWYKLSEVEYNWKVVLICLFLFFWTWIGPDVLRVLTFKQLDFHNRSMFEISCFMVVFWILVDKRRTSRLSWSYWFLLFSGTIVHVSIDKIFTALT
jgi:hypothetical protein